MLAVAAIVLAEGVKGFLEDPAYLLGLPLVVLGALGLLIVISPDRSIAMITGTLNTMGLLVGLRAAPIDSEVSHEGHPSPLEYVRVGLILGIITAVEVVLYYVDAAYGLILVLLLALSGMKFVIVALWFMHLKFDNRLLSMLFSGGMALIIALFFVVLATLGANLV